MLHHNLIHLGDDLLGALQRRALWQLREGDDVAFVLRRNESRWHKLEYEGRPNHQSRINDKHHEFVADNAADAAFIAAGAFLEYFVETTEEPAEQAIDDFCQTIFGGVMAAKKKGGHGGGKSEGVDGRDHGGNRNGRCELFVELSR